MQTDEPDMISWQEFEDWYLNEQDHEKKEQKAMEVIDGTYALYEGKIMSPTKKRIDPKIELMVPIDMIGFKQSLVLVVYDNQDAMIYSVSDWKLIHRICFTPNYDVKVNNAPTIVKKDMSILKNNI